MRQLRRATCIGKYLHRRNAQLLPVSTTVKSREEYSTGEKKEFEMPVVASWYDAKRQNQESGAAIGLLQNWCLPRIGWGFSSASPSAYRTLG